MKKKVISFILCIVMCMGLAVGAFAEETNTEPAAKIGDNEYSSLEDAINNVKDGETIEVVKAVICEKLELPRNENVNYTIEGKVDGIVFGNVTDYAKYNYCVDNGHVNIKNVTVKVSENNYQYFRNLTFDNCTIMGRLCLCENVIFNACTFYAPGTDESGITSKNYSVWCYGTDETFNDCTFYGNGKYVNVYNEGSGEVIYNVAFNNCSFINEGTSNKAALNVKETGNSVLLHYNVEVNNCTLQGAFPENVENTDDTKLIVLKNGLFQVDDRTDDSIQNSIDNKGITVFVDGKQEYPVVATHEHSLVEVAEVAPTCTEDGYEAYYVCECGQIFSDANGENPIEAPVVIPATGHDYSYTYEWSKDMMSCTATRVCNNDASDSVSETVKTSRVVKTAPTCETAGVRTYTAEFTNPIFETQYKDRTDLKALGHDYSYTYEWSEDGTTCTATRVCANDENDVLTEVVVCEGVVTTEATCTEVGTTTYTATFENEAFETQTNSVQNIPATGHNWQYVGHLGKSLVYKCSACGEIQGVSVYTHVFDKIASIISFVK